MARRRAPVPGWSLLLLAAILIGQITGRSHGQGDGGLQDRLSQVKDVRGHNDIARAMWLLCACSASITLLSDPRVPWRRT
jgi:hypothetical protein